MSKDLRVPGKGVTGCVQRSFVQRRGRDGVNNAWPSHFDGTAERLKRSVASIGGDFTGLRLETAIAAEIHATDSVNRQFVFTARRIDDDVDRRHGQVAELKGSLQNGRVTENDRRTCVQHSFIADGPRDDLRTDACDVSGCDGDEGFGVFSFQFSVFSFQQD